MQLYMYTLILAWLMQVKVLPACWDEKNNLKKASQFRRDYGEKQQNLMSIPA